MRREVTASSLAVRLFLDMSLMFHQNKRSSVAVRRASASSVFQGQHSNSIVAVSREHLIRGDDHLRVSSSFIK